VIIRGAENLQETLTKYPLQQQKAVFNEHGMLIFPVSIQHNTVKAEGISYEDEYRGNALAAVFDGVKFDIRFHKAFSKERVTLVLTTLLSQDALAPLRVLTKTYHGKPL